MAQGIGKLHRIVVEVVAAGSAGKLVRVDQEDFTCDTGGSNATTVVKNGNEKLDAVVPGDQFIVTVASPSGSAITGTSTINDLLNLAGAAVDAVCTWSFYD